jgi:hypothetical protein
MSYQSRGSEATLVPWDFQKKKKIGWLAGECRSEGGFEMSSMVVLQVLLPKMEHQTKHKEESFWGMRAAVIDPQCSRRYDDSGEGCGVALGR